MTDLRAAALAYAAIGWPVFPCLVRGKAPLTPHGFKDASTDAATVAGWWDQWPLANVAVACGIPGPDVLDVDVKKGRPGMELFERVRKAGLLRGAAAIVRTPSGGMHVWFEGTGQAQGAVGPGKALELKGRGGYVLVPPSYVVAAPERDDPGYQGAYELVEWRESAASIDFAAVKRFLEPPRPRRLTRPTSGKSIAGLAAWLARQPEGNRNNGLFWAACRALESGHIDLDQLIYAVVSPDFSEREARRTIESACRRVGVSA